MSSMFDYAEAGFRIVMLHGINKDGSCQCGDPECEMQGKHPGTNRWQKVTPHWSDEQLENYSMVKRCYGAILDNHLVIDIDPRNGGNEGYAKLCDDTGIDFKAESGFVVATGGGGWHIYFNRPDSVALRSKLDQYPGVDFKSSGFVVASGSLHASGLLYEREKGFPQDITDPPAALIELLKKPEIYRTEFEGSAMEVTEQQIREMLSCVSPDCDYEEWIRVGMAIHNSTGADGFDLWDEWSSTGEKYDGFRSLRKHWDTFDDSGAVTIGTLIHMATEGGYEEPVIFETTLTADPVAEEQPDGLPVDVTQIDTLRPPAGTLVADACEWINGQSRSKRERLAVAAALAAVGNAGGLSHRDEVYGSTSNLIAFCVAASATGKEAIQQAQIQLHDAAGIGPATHDKPKSEQEMYRNLVTHQCSHYIIDEFGLMMQKLENAKQKGSTPYLEGIPSAIMSISTKASPGSYLPMGGDAKIELQKSIKDKIAAAEKAASENYNAEFNMAVSESLKRTLEKTSLGLPAPFLSLVGYTTPSTFERLLNKDSCTNGFFSRAIIFNEKETNPKIQFEFKAPEMPMGLRMRMAQLSSMGRHGEDVPRIEEPETRKLVKTARDAQELMRKICDWFYEYAEEMKERTGLESLARRSPEMVMKISYILGMSRESKIRTSDDVRWAFAMVYRDITEKTTVAMANIAEEENDKADALIGNVLHKLDDQAGKTASEIRRTIWKSKVEDINKALEILESQGKAKQEKQQGARGRPAIKWFKV